MYWAQTQVKTLHTSERSAVTKYVVWPLSLQMVSQTPLTLPHVPPSSYVSTAPASTSSCHPRAPHKAQVSCWASPALHSSSEEQGASERVSILPVEHGQEMFPNALLSCSLYPMWPGFAFCLPWEKERSLIRPVAAAELQPQWRQYQ